MCRYAHGNSFDRTIAHRCELYNVLTAMGYQVVSFDYRGTVHSYYIWHVD